MYISMVGRILFPTNDKKLSWMHQWTFYKFKFRFKLHLQQSNVKNMCNPWKKIFILAPLVPLTMFSPWGHAFCTLMLCG